MLPEDPKREGATIHEFPALRHVRDVTVEDTVAALNTLVEEGDVRDVLVITVGHDGAPTTMFSGKDPYAFVGLLERLKMQVLGLASRG